MTPPHINWPNSIEWINDPSILQDAFNKGQYADRLDNGELISTVFKSKHRSPHTEPSCTHSQIVVYWESDVKPVAMIHQYLRPDGTIGGSGHPDPKILVIGKKALILRHIPKECE